MAKIMLVEDDNNLREIYEARLLAEGHEIISAHDGEEALALAVREKPELIISDVMMPKISGFDMLDILRSSPETKDTKVIMMTALSQLEDKDRADRLGADRYLVKSQVTLEDVIRVAKEVLEGTVSPTDQTNNATEPVAPIGGGTTDMPPATPNPAPQDQPAQPATDMPLATPPSDTPAPDAAAPAPAADMPVAQPPADDQAQTDTPAVTPVEEPAAPVAAPTEASSDTPTAAPSEAPEVIETAQTANAELNKVEEQIDNFINSNPTGTPTASPDPEAPSIGTPPAMTEPSPAPVPETQAAVPDGFVGEPATPETPAGAPAPEAPAPVATPEAPATAPQPEEAPSPSITKKTIQPLGDPTATPDLNALAAQEAEKEAAQSILSSAAPITPEVAPAPETPAPETPSPEQKPDDPNSIAL